MPLSFPADPVPEGSGVLSAFLGGALGDAPALLALALGAVEGVVGPGVELLEGAPVGGGHGGAHTAPPRR